jgi:hypothetical protein
MKTKQLSGAKRDSDTPATSLDQRLTAEQERFADVLGGLLAERWAQTNSALAGMATVVVRGREARQGASPSQLQVTADRRRSPDYPRIGPRRRRASLDRRTETDWNASTRHWWPPK